MFWNAQSIANQLKQRELELFITNEKIDIILLAETFLNSDNDFSLKNFYVYRNDRQSHAGGVAIAIRHDIEHKLLPTTNTVIIENISIEVNISNTPTIITSAYSPRYTTDFKSDMLLLTSHVTTPFILLGDFNAKHTSWNCNNNNAAGKSLFTLQQSEQFMVFHPTEHTHYPHSGATPSTIDLMVTNHYKYTQYFRSFCLSRSIIVRSFTNCLQSAWKKNTNRKNT